MPPESPPQTPLQRRLQRLESGILNGLLLTMIMLAVGQILLRNLFGSGLIWGDELVRVLVLWVGLGGAMYAARSGSHISINLLSRYLRRGHKMLGAALAQGFTAAVCALAALFSADFVWQEYLIGDLAFARVPAWACELILPIAFTIIAWRYLLLGWCNLQRYRHNPTGPGNR